MALEGFIRPYSVGFPLKAPFTDINRHQRRRQSDDPVVLSDNGVVITSQAEKQWPPESWHLTRFAPW